MYFKNADHKSLFEEYQVRARAEGDKEYTVLCYLLAALDKPLLDYLRPRNINIDGIKAASRIWSSGEKALVKLAINIFTDGSGPAKVNEIFRSLDTVNVKVALEGLTIRYGQTA